MTDYNKATDFAAKDALSSGDPDKIIKGTPIDDEFNLISVAVATKADRASPTFSGTVTVNDLTVNGTVNDLGTVTTADIDGGTADNVVIGGTVPAAATVTAFSNTSGTFTGGLIADSGTALGLDEVSADVLRANSNSTNGGLIFEDVGGAQTDYYQMYESGEDLYVDHWSHVGGTQTNVLKLANTANMWTLDGSLTLDGTITTTNNITCNDLGATGTVGAPQGFFGGDGLGYATFSLVHDGPMLQIGDHDEINKTTITAVASINETIRRDEVETMSRSTPALIHTVGSSEWKASVAHGLGQTGVTYNMTICPVNATDDEPMLSVGHGDGTNTGLFYTVGSATPHPNTGNKNHIAVVGSASGAGLTLTDSAGTYNCGLSWSSSGDGHMYVFNSNPNGDTVLSGGTTSGVVRGIATGSEVTTPADTQIIITDALPATPETDAIYFIV